MCLVHVYLLFCCSVNKGCAGRFLGVMKLLVIVVVVVVVVVDNCDLQLDDAELVWLFALSLLCILSHMFTIQPASQPRRASRCERPESEGSAQWRPIGWECVLLHRRRACQSVALHCVPHTYTCTHAQIHAHASPATKERPLCSFASSFSSRSRSY